MSKETYTYGKRGLLYDKRDLLLYLAYLRAASSTLSCSIFFFSCTEKPAPDALAWPSDARSTELRFFLFSPFFSSFFSFLPDADVAIGRKKHGARLQISVYEVSSVHVLERLCALFFFVCEGGSKGGSVRSCACT